MGFTALVMGCATEQARDWDSRKTPGFAVRVLTITKLESQMPLKVNIEAKSAFWQS
jgi:hypothetical protein